MNSHRLFCAAVALAVTAAPGRAQPADDRPTLNVLAPGINSRGTDLFDDVAAVRQLGHTFRIELVADASPNGRPGIFQYQQDPGRDPPGTRCLRVRRLDDPRLTTFLHDIAAERHATVVLDMDLVNLGAAKWRDQTDKLAALAARVGEERRRAHPDSANTLLAHSAGTVGLSKLIDAGKGDLYPTKIAASPMTWQLSRDVLIVQAAGDLPSTPTGAVAALRPGSAAKDANAWLGRGNTVVRISGQTFDAEPSRLYEATGFRVINPLAAHQESHKLGVRDRDVQVFVPVPEPSARPGEPPPPIQVRKFEAANVSPGQVIGVLEGRGGPAQHGNDADRRVTGFDRLKEQVGQLQPPKGGGIALRAAARLPVDPAGLRARWDEDAGRIVLLADGVVKWRLPPMDADLARAAYRCVFGPKPADPEFSLGVSLGGARDGAAPGHEPAYYVGPIDNTLLGLVLCQADVALGEIAYGGSKELAARGLDGIPGFHSLPELFPAKYAEQPQAGRHLGVGERVVIQSLSSELVVARPGELAYARVPELAVRFGRTTPAERAFADLFGSCYFAVLERVREFRDLAECGRVVGVLKWLKENRVPLEAGTLAWPPRAVGTPHQVAVRSSAKLDDLAPRRPLVVYGEHGPTVIFDTAGGVTRLSYAEGRLKAITRADGRRLAVHADDLGNTVAVAADGVGAAAFVPDADGYLTVIDGVTLAPAVGSVRILGTGGTVAPVAGPEEVVNAAAYRFLGGRP